MSEKKYKEGVGFGQQIQEERDFAEEQEKLKERHNIKDENVVVVEKKTTIQFVVTILIATLKTAAVVCILILATLGLLAMIYPNPRLEMITVLQTILSDACSMIGL